MTGEELERAIEFLLQGQANLQVRMDELAAQGTQTDNRLQTYADTQSRFIEIVTRTLEGLAAAQARTDRKITETNERTEQRIVETNERTDQLIVETNERIKQLITENRTRAAEIDARLDRQAEIGARTDARLDRLAALVERNISGGNGNLEQ